MPQTFPQNPQASVLPGGFACTSNRDEDGTAWVHPCGELDMASAPRLRQVLSDALCDTRLVTLDLHELTFMDTAGVHAIVEACIDARSDDRRIAIVQASDRVQRLFAMTGTGDQLEVVEP